jgi:mRNA-degrading endonuclease RelE of RelBE toxin-antitoxin system
MNSKTTIRFRQMLAKLPKHIRRQVQKAYRLFRQNPNHPSLRFKKIHNTEPIYSARINIDYRAVGVLDGNEIVWFWIGPHAEYNKLLSQL